MKFRLVRPGFALFTSASAISLLCWMMPAAAALPTAGGTSSNAAVARLVSDAQAALKAGKLPLAIIDLKNASSADPHNGQIRAQLGTALMEAGDYRSAEQELRQARRDGAPDQLALPSLFQTMLALKEEKLLLDEFPEPNNASQGRARHPQSSRVSVPELGSDAGCYRRDGQVIEFAAGRAWPLTSRADRPQSGGASLSSAVHKRSHRDGTEQHRRPLV